jgi:IclR family acetate operon transcriptional repressor
MGVSELARRLGLPKSVVHYQLSVLARNRYVTPAAGGYVLGPAALRLGQSPNRPLELRSHALPFMRSLHSATRETVLLSLAVGDQGVHVEQLVSPQEIKLELELGHPFPLHAGAPGRCLLAFLPEATREAILARPLERVGPRTVLDPAQLRELLASIRERGVARSWGERRPAAACISVPVLDPRGVAALSVCGPDYRFDRAAMDACEELLRRTAARLCWELDQARPAQIWYDRRT